MDSLLRHPRWHADTLTMTDVTRARWTEPNVSDWAAFREAHPETFVDADLLADLDSEIEARVRVMAPWADDEERTDLKSDLVLRVIEAATSYRETDERGQPIFDYLKQSRRYIVWHAAGKISSRLRRERRLETVRIADLGPDDPDEPELNDGVDDLPDPQSFDPTEGLIHRDLRDAIANRLSRAQLRVFRLLEAGYTWREIGRLLRLDRRTIHSHRTAIRSVTKRVLEARGEPAPIDRPRPAPRRRRALALTA
jgi:hypothetical protein